MNINKDHRSYSHSQTHIFFENMDFPYYGPGIEWRESLEKNIFKNFRTIKSLIVNPQRFLYGRGKDSLKKIQDAQIPVILFSPEMVIEDLLAQPSESENSLLQQIKIMSEGLNVLGLALKMHQRIEDKEELNYSHKKKLRPYVRTIQEADILSQKINHIKQTLKIPIILQNSAQTDLAAYEQLSEVQFLNLIVNRTDSHFYLDLPEITKNAEIDYQEAFNWIDQVDLSRVMGVQLKEDKNAGKNPSSPLWQVYSYLCQKICLSVVILDFPSLHSYPWEKFLLQLNKAQWILDQYWRTHTKIDKIIGTGVQSLGETQ